VIGSYPGEVVRVINAVLAPFVMVYGLYVIAHGHYGPGGGFAGGVALAVGAVMLRLTEDATLVYQRLPRGIGVASATVGLGLFLLVALAPLVAGANFLEYAGVPVEGVADSRMRYLGILVVEIGVGLAVAGTILMIFDVLAGDRR
jgi:multicomponent Na+:H+ antiporter subunit B